MPIITLGTTEPDAIIVETGTLPQDFFSTLHTNDEEMQESIDFNKNASHEVNDMNDIDHDADQPVDNAYTNNNHSTNSNKNISWKKEESKTNPPIEESNAPETLSLRVRRDLLEFSARSDGSVNCKLCGKIFASRKHWYRHKNRAHLFEPVPLNKCEKCLIFFKSKRGYLGHMSSKHSETLQDATPVLRQLISKKPKVLDPETAIPKTILRNYQSTPTSASASRNTPKAKSLDKKKAQSAAKGPEEIDPKKYRERLVKDESFVMGIIEKVRRQCETEPEMANRRGYTRKPYSLRT